MSWTDTFIADIAMAAWFTACGEPLRDATRQDAALYLTGLGLPALPLAAVADWRAAEAMAQRSDWSRAWWEAESAAERSLRDKAARYHNDGPLLAELSRIALVAHELMVDAAAALSRAGIDDETLARVAAGAAAQACHQAALARAAQAGSDHPFAAKFRLYVSGRWLVGVAGERCFLF